MSRERERREREGGIRFQARTLVCVYSVYYTPTSPLYQLVLNHYYYVLHTCYM